MTTATVARCSGEPVSWLRLERYGLGELPASEARAVTRHLAQCDACRACFGVIEAQLVRGPDLEPSLSAARPQSHVTPASSQLRAAAPRARLGAGRWLVAASLLSAALAFWLILTPRAAGPQPGLPGAKGGGLALELVRLDERGRQLEATHFAASDRFKVLVTCAPGVEASLRVVVFQDGAVFAPFAPPLLAACGNRRSVAGAFSLRGGAAAVCVLSAAPGEAEKVARAGSPEVLLEPHVCVRLEPL